MTRVLHGLISGRVLRRLVPGLAVAVVVGALAFAGTGASSATQSCASWDKSVHGGSGPPVIDRLVADEPYGQLLGEWVADNCMRLNYVQVLGTHNSYHIEPQPALLGAIALFDARIAASLQYTHRPLDEQLGLLGIRQVELDVFADPEGGLYATPLGAIFPPNPDPPKPELLEPGLKVLHVQDVDYETRCLTFVSCLETLRAWSDGNPGHLPLAVLVEAKDDPLDIGGLPIVVPVPFDAEQLDGIDAEIRSVFADDQLITPDDVRGERNTLEEAILMDGWPTLNESRGRLLFMFDNEDVKRDIYVEGHPSLRGRAMFTSSPPGSPEAAFVKLNDPLADRDYIRELVATGYIVRTRADADTIEARLGLTRRRQTALRSGAQFVSTDYPEPDPDFGSGYFVQIAAGGANAGCNPVLSPPGCDPARLER